MGANGKMDLVKETLLEAVETFAATDYISIVTYAGGCADCRRRLPEKAVIKGAIAGLHTAVPQVLRVSMRRTHRPKLDSLGWYQPRHHVLRR